MTARLFGIAVTIHYNGPHTPSCSKTRPKQVLRGSARISKIGGWLILNGRSCSSWLVGPFGQVHRYLLEGGGRFELGGWLKSLKLVGSFPKFLLVHHIGTYRYLGTEVGGFHETHASGPFPSHRPSTLNPCPLSALSAHDCLQAKAL